MAYMQCEIADTRLGVFAVSGGDTSSTYLLPAIVRA